MRIGLMPVVFCSAIALVYAKSCKKSFKDSECYGHCPLNPKDRVAELVEVFNKLRGDTHWENIQNLVSQDFIGYTSFPKAGCHYLTLPFPLILTGFDYYLLHDDDWVQVSHDGTVVATFSLVIILNGGKPDLPLGEGSQIVQTWITSDGLCNYQLKQENFTDYRCLAVQKNTFSPFTPFLVCVPLKITRDLNMLIYQ